MCPFLLHFAVSLKWFLFSSAFATVLRLKRMYCSFSLALLPRYIPQAAYLLIKKDICNILAVYTGCIYESVIIVYFHLRFKLFAKLIVYSAEKFGRVIHHLFRRFPYCLSSYMYLFLHTLIYIYTHINSHTVDNNQFFFPRNTFQYLQSHAEKQNCLNKKIFPRYNMLLR